MKEVRLKDYSKILSCGVASTPEYTNEGVVFLSAQNIQSSKLDFSITKYISSIAHKKLSQNRKVKNGDILITRIGSKVGESCIFNLEKEVSIYVSLTHLRLKKEVNNRFFNYYLKTPYFKNFVLENTISCGGVGNLNVSLLKLFKFSIYNLQQQTAIANYLDYHTAKIDSEISYLEKKSSLLEEYKQSLIFETVTKGLDKSVPIKDSGIDWIGEIPKHWEVKRFKDVFDAEKGSPFPENSTEGIYPYINGGMKPSGFSNCKNSKSNTIVVSEGGASAGYSQIMEQDFWAGSHCYKIGVGRNSTKHTFYLLKGIEKHLMLLKTGSAMPNLQKTRFLNFVIPYSSILSEQKQIADYLDKECGIIDTKVNQYRKKAKLLKEYKQSLIYEAVTGKIEIPKEFF